MKNIGDNINDDEDMKHTKEYTFWGLPNMLTKSRDNSQTNLKEYVDFSEANTGGAAGGARVLGVEEYKTEDPLANGRRIVAKPFSGHS